MVLWQVYPSTLWQAITSSCSTNDLSDSMVPRIKGFSCGAVWAALIQAVALYRVSALAVLPSLDHCHTELGCDAIAFTRACITPNAGFLDRLAQSRTEMDTEKAARPQMTATSCFECAYASPQCNCRRVWVA